MKYRRRILVISLMLVSCCADACTIVSSTPPKYVYLIKMYGDKITGLKYDEISGDLFYEGKVPLSIYKEEAGKNRIAAFEGKSLCIYSAQGSKENCIDRAKGINLPDYFDADRTHAYIESKEWPKRGDFEQHIYIQKGDSHHKKYILQEHRVKNTKSIQERLHPSQYSLCDGSME